MIDETTLELIHGEIDGVIADTDRAELARRLAADPDARHAMAQLRELGHTLGQVPAVDPPADLRQTIMNAVAAQAAAPDRPVVRTEQAGLAERIRAWLAPAPALRFAATLAAGIAIGVLVWPLVATGGAGIDPAGVSGTIGATGTTVMPVDLGRAAGRVVVRPGVAGRFWSVEVELEAASPVELELSWDAARAGLAAVGPIDRATAFGGRAGELAWQAEGDHRLDLSLEAPAGATIELSLLENGARTRTTPITLGGN